MSDEYLTILELWVQCFHNNLESRRVIVASEYADTKCLTDQAPDWPDFQQFALDYIGSDYFAADLIDYYGQ